MHNKLLRNFIIYGMFSSLSSLLGFFLLPYYSKVFVPGEYAVLDLTQTIIYLISILGILQLESAIGRYHSEVDVESFKKYVSTSLFSILIISCSFSFLVIINSGLLSRFLLKDIRYMSLIIISTFIIPFQNLVGFGQVILQFEEKVFKFGILLLVQIVTLLFLTYLLIEVFNIGLIGAMGAITLSYTVTSILALSFIREHLSFYWDRNILARLLKYSLPLVPVVFISYSNAHLGRVIISKYVSLEQVGLLSASIKICYMLKLIELSFRKVWYPFFYKVIKEDGYVEKLRALLVKVILILSILFILFELSSAWIIRLLLSESYQKSASMVNLLAVYNFLVILIQIVNVGSSAVKKTGYNIIPISIGLIINLSALVLLGPFKGIYSVPIALVLSSFAMFVISLIITSKLFPLKFPYMLIAISLIIQLFLAL